MQCPGDLTQQGYVHQIMIAMPAQHEQRILDSWYAGSSLNNSLLSPTAEVVAGMFHVRWRQFNIEFLGSLDDCLRLRLAGSVQFDRAAFERVGTGADAVHAFFAIEPMNVTVFYFSERYWTPTANVVTNHEEPLFGKCKLGARTT